MALAVLGQNAAKIEDAGAGIRWATGNACLVVGEGRFSRIIRECLSRNGGDLVLAVCAGNDAEAERRAKSSGGLPMQPCSTVEAAIAPFGLSREAAQAPITTRRLYLRLPLCSDIAALSRLVSDPVIAGFTSQIRYPYTARDARQFVTFCETDTSPHLAAHFLLALRANPKLVVGGAGFTWMAGGIPEIGYWIAAPYRRRGFAGDATRAILHRLFTQSVTRTVQAWVHIGNKPSQRLLQRAGFRRTGFGMHHSRAQGRHVPAALFSLTRADWAKQIPRWQAGG